MFFFNMDSKVEGLETINILKNNLFETLQKCFTDSNNKEDEIYSNNITVSENKAESCKKNIDPDRNLQAIQSELPRNISLVKEHALNVEAQQTMDSMPKTTNTKLYKSSRYRAK